MIVDFHTHLLPETFRARRAEIAARDATFAALFGGGPQRMASAEEIAAAMDEDGVDVSVAMGYGWCDLATAREANDCLLEAAAEHPGRIVAFCAVHPGWGGDAALAEIERCAEAGARGIGELHPASQGIDPLRDGSLEPLMHLAAERGLIVAVHGSEPVGHAYAGKGTTTPPKLLDLARRFPEVRFVFAHWGGGLAFYGLMPEVRRALANAYFDSAASPLLYDERVFDAAVRCAGSDRVLLGSDYPLVRARRVIDQARRTLGPDDAAAALGGNAAALLGLGDG